MTRTLANLLSTNDAQLRLQLAQLERANSHQNSDIKLSVEVVQAAKQKVHDLGLDRHDTTPRELYHLLRQRVNDDDRRLERALRTRAATHISAEALLMDGIVHALQSETSDKTVSSIKNATAKRLFKANPAKKVMKALGYRSQESMLRQEAPALLIVAASHIESAAWRKAWFDSYKKLKPSDFESRTLTVIHPSSAKWQAVASRIVSEQAHTVNGVPECGALVVLPFPDNKPAGMVLASIALALHEINRLIATTTYIKAAQVQADFGARVAAVAHGDVAIDSEHMPHAVPWQLLQRYVARSGRVVHEDILGPYVKLSDFAWHNVEASLIKLCPSLAFWEGSSHLQFSHDGQTVSLNIIDAAIDACNTAAYELRGYMHAQQALWSELMLRYLNHENVERSIAGLLNPHLALETADN